MSDTKTGGNRWVPDIRPENMDTYTETHTPEGGGAEQTEEYKITDAHPVIGGLLNKLAFFRTHAAAVWYNRLGKITMKQKIDEMQVDIDRMDGLIGRPGFAFYTGANPINYVFDLGASFSRPMFLVAGSAAGTKVMAMYGTVSTPDTITKIQGTDIVREHTGLHETVEINRHLNNERLLRIRLTGATGMMNHLCIIMFCNAKLVQQWNVYGR